MTDTWINFSQSIMICRKVMFTVLVNESWTKDRKLASNIHSYLIFFRGTVKYSNTKSLCMDNHGNTSSLIINSVQSTCICSGCASVCIPVTISTPTSVE